MLIAFFVLTRVLITWDPFYEDGNYINYLKSFITDFDLNLINQQSDLYNWMATKFYYDTSQHTFLQTPFLLIISLPELLIMSLGLGPNSFLNYHFTSYLFSVTSLLVGFYYTKKALVRFHLSLSLTHIFLILFGSTLFYFSFLRYNVLEIFAFALVSRIFYLACITDKKNTEFKPVVDGGVLAILLCLKPAYVPIVCYVLITTLYKSYKEKEFKKIILFVSSSLLLLIVNYLLWIQKYGMYPSFTRQFSEVMKFDFSLFISKFLLLFELKGFFIANPSLAIGTLGSIFFLYKNRKRGEVSLALIGIWILWLMGSFTQTFFIAMPLLDDHLVGRLNLTALPLYILGFVFIWEKYTSVKLVKYFMVFSILLISVLSTLYFISHDIQGHFSYAQSKTISLESFEIGMFKYKDLIFKNMNNFYLNYIYIFSYFLYCFITSEI